jgi:uncharacterized protein YndB with AHSA1/START domain
MRVVSPLLANVYLHEVLDVWFQSEVQPRLRGRSFLIRYADDFVIGFADENGDPDDSIEPTETTVTLDSDGGKTRMTTLSRFVSLEQLEKLVEMGMEEGMTLAMGQIDDVLRA